ncbi:SDR family oxidoreductase [Kroppenstedtia eburnea]|uniref:NAD(P)-dependent dehydrogenase, short-chain alcohol dehydrogenase family n=1 Tax=Kroppenstedtia eburnea TaxID=714067 RepID=A0A1N7Q8H9_9BACL|nr:SDR family oxidoreductase [Kroppenstedtia eburnea]EGK12903.1 short-chain dehydrogenase/reductase family oxidoreductase [Desmospora sp. 8437]QKI82598.1 SDR family oxidoreductase [Kroppenstedtia eburnea]SIT19160.1 NAD(P)-dependent dehydrogenase, short-chain alcohol dehydrogenase family [Kroppenstedtia eburnea]
MKSNYKSLLDLTGKSVIVTGGLGILGRRFCTALAEFGANVAVIDLDTEAAQEFATQLSQTYQTDCIGIGCDVSSPIAVKRMVQKVIQHFGQIDILHNNAATKTDDLEAYFMPFEQYSLDQWRRVMAVNLDGMFLVAQQVGREMVKRGVGGSMIFTASIYGLVAPDHRIYRGAFYSGHAINTPAVYSASKAALYGLTKYLSTYWAKEGIRVNMLTLGGVESGQNEMFKRQYALRTPLARMGRADEMVSALIFLASEASSYVTGQNVVIDGGLSSW